MEYADGERTACGELCFGRTVSEKLIAKQHEHAAHNEHNGHHHHISQQGIDVLVAKSADNHGRDEGDEQLIVEVPFAQCALNGRQSFGWSGVVEPKKAFPIQHHHRQDGAKLNDNVESFHKLVALDAQQGLCNNHVARRRYGEKLGESLHDGHDNGLQYVHVVLRFLLLFLLLFRVFGFAYYGVDDGDET